MGMGDFGYFFQIDQVCIGIADDFHKNRLCIRLHRLFKPSFLRRIHKAHRDSPIRQGMGKIVEGSSVKSRSGHNMISGLGQRLYGIGNGSSARGHGQGGRTVLQRCNSFFEHFRRGIGQPAVNISRIRKPEPCRRMGAVFEHKGCTGIDGNRSGPGCGIWAAPAPRGAVAFQNEAIYLTFLFHPFCTDGEPSV